MNYPTVYRIRQKQEQISRAVIPLIVANVMALLQITSIEPITMFLPNLVLK